MTVIKSADGFTASGFGSVLCAAVRHGAVLTIVCFHFIVVQLPQTGWARIDGNGDGDGNHGVGGPITERATVSVVTALVPASATFTSIGL